MCYLIYRLAAYAGRSRVLDTLLCVPVAALLVVVVGADFVRRVAGYTAFRRVERQAPALAGPAPCPPRG